MRDVSLHCRFLLQWVSLVLSGQWRHDDLFLRAVYRTYLKREPDETGLQQYARALRLESTSRLGVVLSVVRSDEFRQVRDLRVPVLEALHRARVILVQDLLPPAQDILDLGGSATGNTDGALIFMGYQHNPRQITIVDLPPDGEAGKRALNSKATSVVAGNGTRVRYIYQSMVDLSSIPEESMDMVWSGQSIEHVTEAEADIVCRDVYRILKPGGHFCLDTPNAALTRLQSPDALIHPEHKKEYLVSELRAKLERWGFHVVEAKGICPMPLSLRNGVFQLAEITRNIRLSEVPEEGYLFYLKAVKPLKGGSG